MSNAPTPAEIIELRERLGVSQNQLAARLGVSQAAVNRWEHGLRVPTGLARKALLALMEESAGIIAAARS